MERPKDLIRSTEARKLIGVSHIKMAQLLKDGTIRYFTDPLDSRKKLVSRSAVLALRGNQEAAA